MHPESVRARRVSILLMWRGTVGDRGARTAADAGVVVLRHAVDARPVPHLLLQEVDRDRQLLGHREQLAARACGATAHRRVGAAEEGKRFAGTLSPMDIPASPCEFARRGATTARANNAGIRILITTSPLLSWYLRRWGLTIPAASLRIACQLSAMDRPSLVGLRFSDNRRALCGGGLRRCTPAYASQPVPDPVHPPQPAYGGKDRHAERARPTVRLNG